jgi:hypothetical protein
LKTDSLVGPGDQGDGLVVQLVSSPWISGATPTSSTSSCTRGAILAAREKWGTLPISGGCWALSIDAWIDRGYWSEPMSSGYCTDVPTRWLHAGAAGCCWCSARRESARPPELWGEPKQLVAEGAKPFDVAVALVESLRAVAPAVLIVEDLHWADEATLDVVRVLARQARYAALLLVLSYRSDELHRDHPLRMVLCELRSGDVVTRMELGALSRETVGELPRLPPGDRLPRHRRPARNPVVMNDHGPNHCSWLTPT